METLQLNMRYLNRILWYVSFFLRFCKILISVLFLSISLNGCAGVNRYYLVAIPVINIDGSGITKKGVINLNDLTITLRPSYRIDIGYDNTHYKPSQHGFQMRYYKDEEIVSKPPKFFYIDVLIKPNIADISFEPTKMTLISKNRERIPATSYEGPLAINSKNVYALGLCKPKSAIDSNWPNLNLEMGKDYCFAIKFAVQPTLDAEFSLELNGIVHDGVQIHIPPIRFITETISHYES